LQLVEQSHAESVLARSSDYSVDGIIARIGNQAIAQAIVQTGLPVVDVGSSRPLPTIPCVDADDYATADLAFNHLHERGFRRFGFCHQTGDDSSTRRLKRFTERVKEADCACAVHESPPDASSGPSWADDARRMAHWVETLQRPVGILACCDTTARRLTEGCRIADVAIPDELAVVGVGDDELLCDLAHPPLTSVTPDTWRVGYLAAELLDRLLAGKRVPSREHLVKPVGIAARLSTDIVAIDDADVARALRFIRGNALTGIKVTDVLAHVPLSRRALESRFRALVGRTPHEQIELVRLRHARELLAETELPVATIAERLGFDHTEYFSVFFKRAAGESPRSFRSRKSRT
jgi:LacI family transcriptional regulator